MGESALVFHNKSYNIGNQTFLVLYGDSTCLILGKALNETGFTDCSLWFPKKSWGYLSPPTCCEFLFVVLCSQGTKFDWNRML
ncbi:hypothetical protein MTO96_046477 [Rhipicephalus appendiculatus]